jgi:hypothetical protein
MGNEVRTAIPIKVRISAVTDTHEFPQAESVSLVADIPAAPARYQARGECVTPKSRENGGNGAPVPSGYAVESTHRNVMAPGDCVKL